jgi:hypothetical protein
VAILVLLDAEGDCPSHVAKSLSSRAAAIGVYRPVVIVIAQQMFESWFLASIETLADQLVLPDPFTAPDPEAIGNPKRWLNRHFPPGRAYKETQDQEAMTFLINIKLVEGRSRSFRRLLKAVNEALHAIDCGESLVTPVCD